MRFVNIKKSFCNIAQHNNFSQKWNNVIFGIILNILIVLPKIEKKTIAILIGTKKNKFLHTIIIKKTYISINCLYTAIVSMASSLSQKYVYFLFNPIFIIWSICICRLLVYQTTKIR